MPRRETAYRDAPDGSSLPVHAPEIPALRDKEDTMPHPERTRPFPVTLRLLALALFVLAATSSASAQETEYELSDYDSLKTLFDEAYRSKEYEAAIDIGGKVLEIVAPKHFDMLYDIACLHALSGDKWKAYRFLQMAVDAGFWNARGMNEDEALASLRGEDHFRDLVRGAWANGYVWLLERDERDEFQKPDEVMRVLAFKEGEKVADIGAGSGYFAVRIAKAVGPTGEVLAHDISPHMLAFLEKRIKAEQLGNVILKKVERDDPQLPERGVNTIIMVDTIHYIKERTAYVKKLREGLAPGGRLVIIDYRVKPFEERPWGPPPEQQIPKEQLNAEIEAAGFKRVADHDFLPEQYFMVYQPE
jgi:SAM-dependent methyltransferase